MSDPEDTSIMGRYEKLRQYLIGVDVTDLEKAYMVTAGLLEETAELAARAAQALNVAKHNLDLAAAQAGLRLREPLLLSNASQARIDNELKLCVPLAPEVIAARVAVGQAQCEFDTCHGLFISMKEQGRQLGKATEMVTSGYARPDAANDLRRAEIRRASIMRPRS